MRKMMRRALVCGIAGFGLWAALNSVHAQGFPRYFLVSYGDNSQVFDNPGSIDDLPFYNALVPVPQCFVDWVQNAHGNGMGWMDDLRRNPVNRAYPFVLYGYPRLSNPLYDRRGVEEAFLRFDIYYDPSRDIYCTEDIIFWDERSCDPNVFPASFHYGERLCELLSRQGQSNRPQWISITIDLITGWAYAQEIDPAGNPIRDYGALPRRWGEHPSDRGSPSVVIDLAADRRLYGRIADDLVPSFVAFSVKLACPPNPWQRGDINGDGVVDDADLLTVLFNFGTRIRCDYREK